MACTGGSEAPPASRGEGAATPVAAIEIQPRDLSRQLSLSGTVAPRATVRLASRIAGGVESVRVEEGQWVSAGELLATLDMAETRAELARARAEERAAEVEFRRAEELHARGMLSAAQRDVAEVGLQVAQSEHALWRTRVEFGRIVSPLDAVVAARHVEPGEAVQAQATLFELAALDELTIRVGVSELDVVHLRPGHAMSVRLDALPELELAATVKRIFPVAESASRLTTVEIALPSEAGARGVRPGFLARIRSTIDPRPGALVVPAAAVGVADGQAYVYVIEDGRLLRRKVGIGVTRGSWSEVVEGLATGEMVLASNPLEMRDGQPVRIVAMRDKVHGH